VCRSIRLSSMLAVVTAIAVTVAGCASSSSSRSSGSGTGESSVATLSAASSPAPVQSTSTGSAAGSCAYPAAGSAAKNVGTPPTTGISHTDVTETLTTSQGTITLTLNAAAAPCTVNSFVFLASKGYFNGTICHRLTTAGIYVLQCGDPTGTGTGGPGYSFADENLTGATYPAATVAMANAGPNTNGSQFFLVYQDTQLAPSYTPFGTVTGGLDVLTKIAAAGTADGSSDGKPKLPVTITSVTRS
jgi:peptidyl-prolyl cis-trans isomerase B (cyclophilin B)